MRRLNLQRLEIFRAVFETGNISMAARRLQLAQPTVSRHLAMLEDELGFALFIRHPGRIEPTWEAFRLHADIAGLFERLTTVEEAVTAIRSGSDEVLRIMAATSYSLRMLPQAIALWRKGALATGLTTGLSVDVGGAAKQIRALRAGEIDLAISGALPQQPGLRVTIFGRQALVAVLPRDHALAHQDRIALSDFSQHPCVLLSPDAPVGATVHQAFADQGIVPQRIMTAVDPPLAVGLAAGLGCLSIVDRIVFESLATPGLIMRPLDRRLEFDTVTLELDSSPPRRSIADFQAALRKVAARFPGGV